MFDIFISRGVIGAAFNPLIACAQQTNDEIFHVYVLLRVVYRSANTQISHFLSMLARTAYVLRKYTRLTAITTARRENDCDRPVFFVQFSVITQVDTMMNQRLRPNSHRMDRAWRWTVASTSIRRYNSNGTNSVDFCHQTPRLWRYVKCFCNGHLYCLENLETVVSGTPPSKRRPSVNAKYALFASQAEIMLYVTFI